MDSRNKNEKDESAVRISRLRVAGDLSQEELREKLSKLRGKKYSRETITQWENGTRQIKSDDLICLAKFFNVTTDYILGLEDETSHEGHSISKQLGLDEESQKTLADLAVKKKEYENLISAFKKQKGGLVLVDESVKHLVYDGVDYGTIKSVRRSISSIDGIFVFINSILKSDYLRNIGTGFNLLERAASPDWNFPSYALNYLISKNFDKFLDAEERHIKRKGEEAKTKQQEAIRKEEEEHRNDPMWDPIWDCSGCDEEEWERAEKEELSEEVKELVSLTEK